MKKKLFSPPIIFIIGLIVPFLGNTLNIYLISDYVSFNKDGDVLLPMREAMLNVITFGIYGIIWTYRINKTVNYALSDNKKGFVIFTTVLSALPLRFLSMTLITNKILLSEKR